MHIRYKIICFLFVLFFPGKAYSDSNWWDYFDYAGVTWTVEEFRTIGSGHNSLSNFTLGLVDGVDVHTDTSFDIFLGKKFDRTKGEINYSKNNFKDLRTNYSQNQLHYLHTDFAIQELNFNGFYDLFQSKRLNFSIGGGPGIAMVKMTGETYRNTNGQSVTKINDNHNDTIFTYNVSLGLGYRFRSDALLDIRVGHKEFMNEIRQQTSKISNGAANGYVTSDLSSNFIKFRIVKEF
jgi:opacity protein-like surface antigen